MFCVCFTSVGRAYIPLAVAQFVLGAFLILGGQLEIREQGILFMGKLTCRTVCSHSAAKPALV